MKRNLVESSIVNIDRIRSKEKGFADFPETVWKS